LVVKLLAAAKVSNARQWSSYPTVTSIIATANCALHLLSAAP